MIGSSGLKVESVDEPELGWHEGSITSGVDGRVFFNGCNNFTYEGHGFWALTIRMCGTSS